MDGKDPKDIWVLTEFNEEGVLEIVLELASEGHKLAGKLGERLCAVVLAKDQKDFGESLSQFGVDVIYHAKAKNEGDASPYILSDLMQKYNPRLMLIGETPWGSKIAPIIAARNDIGIITHCVIMGLNGRGNLEVTKMIYGDKIYATFEALLSKTKIVTVMKGSFDLMTPYPKTPVQLMIEEREAFPPVGRVKYLQFVKGDPKKIDLSEAEIIVAVGKGVGSNEGIEKIEKLAELLGGSLGGSRVAVDQGWIPFEKQIGQTGKTVTPKLFISCGISGAFEFTAGIKDSKLIVAVNTDEKAPIFRVSNLGLVGDLHTIVPEIVKQLEKHIRE